MNQWQMDIQLSQPTNVLQELNWFKNGKKGYHAKTDDSTAVVQYIEELLGSPEKRESMAKTHIYILTTETMM